MNLEIMGKIDADYNVSNTSDPEVKQRWFPLGIKLGYNITDKAKEFVQGMGRWKYVKPIYQALLDSDQKELAIQWYNEVADFYHPYVVDQLTTLLGIKSENEKPPAIVKRWNEKFLGKPTNSRS